MKLIKFFGNSGKFNLFLILTMKTNNYSPQLSFLQITSSTRVGRFKAGLKSGKIGVVDFF